MAAHDLLSLAYLKAMRPVTGTALDSEFRKAITTASGICEAYCDRRLLYRAPPAVTAANDIVAVRNLANETVGSGDITQPNSAGRTLVVTLSVEQADGTLTVTGTVGGTAGTTETWDLSAGTRQHGVKFFTAISSVVVSGVTAASGTITIGGSAGYTEYHTPQADESRLASLEWPIQQVLEVNEDAARAYAAATILTSGTDYLVRRDRSGDELVRLSSLLPRAWTQGWRSVKHVHSAGYTRATLPEEIRNVCGRLALLLFDEAQKRLGMSGETNAAGQWTRFGPAALNREMKGQLSLFRRRRLGSDTGERDFDLEAA